MLVAQQLEIPRFKGGVDVVQFTVSILDKDRRPVTGLAAADFEVPVNGQPRPPSGLPAVTPSDDQVPEPMPSAASVAPDVQTNKNPAEGRLVIVVMVRSIRDEDRQRAHAIAHAAIDRLGPNDLG